MDIDHLHERQMGGGNDDMVRAIDRSVNRSFGSQIRHQTKHLAEGTEVIIIKH